MQLPKKSSRSKIERKWNASILKMRPNPNRPKGCRCAERSSFKMEYLLDFPRIYSMFIGRASLFAWLANNAEGVESEQFPFEIQMMVCFFSCTGAPKSTFNTNSLLSFFAQSLRHNWTNSTKSMPYITFDSIYRPFCWAFREAVYHYTKMKNEKHWFRFIWFYAFYLFDFPFTILQIVFCFHAIFLIDICRFVIGSDFLFHSAFVCLCLKQIRLLRGCAVCKCVRLFFVNRQIRIGKGVLENCNNK